MSLTGRLKRLTGIAALVMAGTAAGLLCAEGLLHLTDYTGLIYERTFPAGYYTPAEGGYDIAPNVAPVRQLNFEASYDIWSNNLGCFDTPYTGEQPYLFLIGDSFTWGFAPFPDKWGTRLESYLGTRVLKCGVNGYGTRQEFQKTQRLLSVLPKPEAVIVGYFVNDYADDRAPDRARIVVDGELIQNPWTTTDPAALKEIRDRTKARLDRYCTSYEPAHPAFQRVKCLLRKHSVVYALAISAVKGGLSPAWLRRVGIVNTPPPVAAGVAPSAGHEQQHFQNILDFKRLADRLGIQLLFVMIPSQEMVESQSPGTDYAEVEALMDRQGIVYYDPLPDFRAVARATRAPLYWKWDPHLNERGNHLLGLLVARRLLAAPQQAALRTRVDHDLEAEFSFAR